MIAFIVQIILQRITTVVTYSKEQSPQKDMHNDMDHS